MIRTVTNDPTRRAKLFTIHPRKLHPRVVILLGLCVSLLWIYDVSTLTVNRRQSVILSHSEETYLNDRNFQLFVELSLRTNRSSIPKTKRNEITKNSTEKYLVCAWEIYEIWSNFSRAGSYVDARPSMSSVEKCWAAVRGEGVTRIPGAAVHVGLIDSQRRRARVISCNAACASFRANTEGRCRLERETGILFFSFVIYPEDIAKWISKSSTVHGQTGGTDIIAGSISVLIFVV